VIILVGDAPPHQSSWNRLRSKIIQFVCPRDGAGASVVSALYAGDPTTADPNSYSAAAKFAEIARLGKGDFVTLEGRSSVDRRMLLAVIGVEYESEVWKLLAGIDGGVRSRLIDRRVKEKDIGWLCRKLTRLPIHPEVVAGLIRLGGKQVLGEMRRIVTDDRQAMQARNAALYVIRRLIPGRVHLDPRTSLDRQRAELERLDLLIGSQ
jgi:hypothetical protein